MKLTTRYPDLDMRRPGLFAPARRLPLWVHCVLALSLIAAGCGAAGIEYPSAGAPNSSAEAPNSVGGAVFFDRDGDGQPSADDNPVEAATVSPLGVDQRDDNTPTFAPDPNTEPTATTANGSFILNYRFRVDRPGAAVSLAVPIDGTDSFGTIDTLVELSVDSLRNNVALSFEPQACADCGTPAPPDLVPIVAWDQIDAEARSQLQASTSAPGAQGLLPGDTWFVEVADGRTLLRFSSVTANLGEGPLDVIAQRADLSGFTPTWQRIWTDEWNYQDVPSGEFVFHADHDHVHFDAFERYRLLDGQGQVVAESSKVSFCLRDSIRVSDAPMPTTGIFGNGDCGDRQQAINPGFADHYNQFLPDQWIDITGVPSGDYTVEITVDPTELIIEADETNNVAFFEVTIE